MAFHRGKGLLERLGRIRLLDTVCMCVCRMFSSMQHSEAHSNASDLTTWGHQIRMIYSLVLAFTVSSGATIIRPRLSPDD